MIARVLCLVLSLGLASVAVAELPTPVEGIYASFGIHQYHAYDPGESAGGVSASLLFRPHALMPLSRRMSQSGFGFAVRWNRSHLPDLARVEGAELLLRRYLRSGGHRWQSFLGAGLGQYGVDWDFSDRKRSSWSAALEGGVEWEWQSHWLLEICLHNRFIEFAEESFSGTSLIVTFGARIDA